ASRVAFFCRLRSVISWMRSVMTGVLVFCVAEEQPTSGNLETALRLGRYYNSMRPHVDESAAQPGPRLPPGRLRSEVQLYSIHHPAYQHPHEPRVAPVDDFAQPRSIRDATLTVTTRRPARGKSGTQGPTGSTQGGAMQPSNARASWMEWLPPASILLNNQVFA